MMNPPALPEIPKPHISDIGLPPQLFSPEAEETESRYASPLLSNPRPSQLSSRKGSMTSLSTNYSRRQTPITSSRDLLISRDNSLEDPSLKISHV